MRDITLSELQRLEPATTNADEALYMDQDTFRALYDRTAKPLWVYLFRRTNSAELADDLLQDTYYRFLRTREHVELTDDHASMVTTNADAAGQSVRRTDLARALSQLKPRQRDALWLAYAEGSSHEEIAQALGVKAGSIKLILFRARRKLAGLLRGGK